MIQPFPDKTPLTIFQGTDLDIPPLRVRDSTGAYFDFTGWTAKMQARKDASAASLILPPLLELSTANGGIVIATSYITLKMTAAQTAALNFGASDANGNAVALYDMILTQPVTGFKFIYFYGPITLSSEVTR